MDLTFGFIVNLKLHINTKSLSECTVQIERDRAVPERVQVLGERDSFDLGQKPLNISKMDLKVKSFQ